MLGDIFVRGTPRFDSLYLIRLRVAEQGLRRIDLFVTEILFYQQLFLQNPMLTYVCLFIKYTIWSNFPKSVSFLHCLWMYWWWFFTCKSPTCSRASTDPCVVNDLVRWRNRSPSLSGVINTVQMVHMLILLLKYCCVFLHLFQIVINMAKYF